jgi:AraC family transcriptional regulator of arabinose operon
MDVGLNVHYAGNAYSMKSYETNERRLDHYYIRIQTEGHSLAKLNGIEFFLSPGSVLIALPGDLLQFIVEINYETTGFCSAFYTGCSGKWLEEWWHMRPRLQYAQINFSKSVLTIVDEILMEQRRIKKKELRASPHLIRILFLYLDREEIVKTANGASKQQSFIAIRMRDYMEDHACHPFKLKNVADHVGLSVYRAAHLFKEFSGYTLLQYVMEVRLNMAYERMFKTNLNLEEISRSCGFSNYSSFHKNFRKKYSMSPKECRNSMT